MTTALVTKSTVLKAGNPYVVNPDGVIVVNPGSSALYYVDTLLGDGQAVQFTGAVEGVTDVSYATLLSLASAAYPSEYP